MTIPYKLKVRVGDAEFEAEGSEDAVRDQFDLFMGCLADRPLRKHLHANDDNADEQDDDEPDDEVPPVSRSQGPSSISDDVFNRAFRVDGEKIALRTLPNGDSTTADALILIIYGITRFSKKHEAIAGDVTAAARQSGITLSRIDRTLAECETLVRKGGKKRGTRYTLTNPGISRAEELLNSMFK